MKRNKTFAQAAANSKAKRDPLYTLWNQSLKDALVLEQTGRSFGIKG